MNILGIIELRHLIYLYLGDVDVVNCASCCVILRQSLQVYPLQDIYGLHGLGIADVTIMNVTLSSISSSLIMDTINSYKSNLNIYYTELNGEHTCYINPKHFLIMTVPYRVRYTTICDDIITSYKQGTTLLQRADVIVYNEDVSISKKARIPDGYESNVINIRNYITAYIIVNKYKKHMIVYDYFHDCEYTTGNINMYMDYHDRQIYRPMCGITYDVRLYWDKDIHSKVHSLICDGFRDSIVKLIIDPLSNGDSPSSLLCDVFPNMKKLRIMSSTCKIMRDITVGHSVTKIINNNKFVTVHTPKIPNYYTTAMNSTLYDLVRQHGTFDSLHIDRAMCSSNNRIRFHNNSLTISIMPYDPIVLDFIEFCLGLTGHFTKTTICFHISTITDIYKELEPLLLVHQNYPLTMRLFAPTVGEIIPIMNVCNMLTGYM